MDLVKAYQKINRYYSKKLVFRIGTEAGFFSEYNNMILAMVWCLKHRKQFSLYSENSWFSAQGWTEFFEPFCEEERSPLHLRLNTREVAPPNGKKTRLLTAWIKMRYGIHHLTWEVWKEFRDRELEQESYDIPELGIHGTLQEACRVINDVVCRYNPATQQAVDQLIKSVGLPDCYLGFHIRGGDKFIEDDLQPISKYFDEITEHSDCRNAFVLTDDYRIIQTIKKDYPDWTIYTLCKEEEQGYYHKEFMRQPQSIIREQMLRLFASTDILRKSEFFIGTFTSNPGMYLGMRMARGKCLDVAGREWFIW